MDLIAPAFAACALLLAAAGVAKLRTPAPTAIALGKLHLPARTTFVRVIGASEVGLGIACLVVPSSITGGLLAAAYLLFAGVVAALSRAEGEAVPCGCFGEGSFAAGRAHVGFNLLAAAMALAAATAPPPPPAEWLGDPLAGLAALAATACTAWLGYVIFTVVPSTWGAWNQ